MKVADIKQALQAAAKEIKKANPVSDEDLLAWSGYLSYHMHLLKHTGGAIYMYMSHVRVHLVFKNSSYPKSVFQNKSRNMKG